VLLAVMAAFPGLFSGIDPRERGACQLANSRLGPGSNGAWFGGPSTGEFHRRRDCPGSAKRDPLRAGKLGHERLGDAAKTIVLAEKSFADFCRLRLLRARAASCEDREQLLRGERLGPFLGEALRRAFAGTVLSVQCGRSILFAAHVAQWALVAARRVPACGLGHYAVDARRERADEDTCHRRLRPARARGVFEESLGVVTGASA
jgi:hypothetical protein